MKSKVYFFVGILICAQSSANPQLERDAIVTGLSEANQALKSINADYLLTDDRPQFLKAKSSVAEVLKALENLPKLFNGKGESLQNTSGDGMAGAKTAAIAKALENCGNSPCTHCALLEDSVYASCTVNEPNPYWFRCTGFAQARGSFE